MRAATLSTPTDYVLRFPLDGTTEVVWLQLTPYLIALNFDYDLAFKRLNPSMMRSREAAAVAAAAVVAIRRLLHSATVDTIIPYYLIRESSVSSCNTTMRTCTLFYAIV